MLGRYSRIRAENGDVAAGLSEGSALLSQDGLPIGTSWPYSQFFYEHPEDSIERNFSCRQVSVTDFSASDLRSTPEMQMRSYDWAVADRVPVVEQDLCDFSVNDSIVIAHNINLPSIASQARIDNAIILLQPKHESRRAAEGDGSSTVHSQEMWVRRGIIAAVNSNHGIRHT